MQNKFIIFDLWADKLPDHFEPAVRWFQSLGLTVILAHPERMRAVQDEPEIADYFAELGLLLQGNLQCFADLASSPTRRTAERYLREGRYFCLGSDCHGPSSMPGRLQGLKHAIDQAGNEVVDRLTIENPRRLLAIDSHAGV
jgi:protein-tyrosine phosphatase